MQYPITFWRTISARKEEATQDTRPACPGNFLEHLRGCSRRPDHIVAWTSNRSGLPGNGTPEAHPACGRHLNTVIKLGEELAEHVTVSAYTGV